MSDHRGVLLKAALELRLDLDEAALGRLLDYLELLQKWNRIYNLTAVRDPASMLSHHLYDCMATVHPVRRKIGANLQFSVDSARPLLLDVGSGAGLPGMVLAICEPRLQVYCIDAVEKKIAFLRHVAGQLRLDNLQAIHGRVEALKTLRPELAFHFVTARAFASLAQFVEATAPVVAEGGLWMAMKARDPAAEIDALPSNVEMFHVEQLKVPALRAERCLVWMRQKQQSASADVDTAASKMCIVNLTGVCQAPPI